MKANYSGLQTGGNVMRNAGLVPALFDERQADDTGSPASSPTLLATSSFAFSNPWDVMVKGDNVYVSDRFYPSPGGQIVLLDKNLGSAISPAFHQVHSWDPSDLWRS